MYGRALALAAITLSAGCATNREVAGSERALDRGLPMVLIGTVGDPMVNGKIVPLASFDAQLRSVAAGQRVCVEVTRDRTSLPMVPALFQLFRTAEAADIKVAFRSMGDCATRGSTPLAVNAGDFK